MAAVLATSSTTMHRQARETAPGEKCPATVCTAARMASTQEYKFMAVPQVMADAEDDDHRQGHRAGQVGEAGDKIAAGA